MVYMAADNDMYDQALADLDELSAIPDHPGATILVQLDSRNGAQRLAITHSGTRILSQLGRINSASPQELADFGSWAVATAPAAHYLLVLWDHGNGWSKGRSPKYIGYDETFDDYLSVAQGELRQAVLQVARRAGKPIDIVLFDACSMQMAEVLLELSDAAAIAVGSQALFPLAGVPYDRALAALGSDPGLPPESLACDIVTAVGESYGDSVEITFSAVAVESLRVFSRAFTRWWSDAGSLPLASYIPSPAIIDSVQSFPPVASYDLDHLLGFAAGRLPQPQASALSQSRTLLRQSVIANVVHGAGYRNASGISVWWAAVEEVFWARIPEYWRMNWPRAASWDRFIHACLGAPDRKAPVLQSLRIDEQAPGSWLAAWRPEYDPSGIAGYRWRISGSINPVFTDPGSDTAQWVRSGFTSTDQGYFATVDSSWMASRRLIDFSPSGGFIWHTRGQGGGMKLERSSDSLRWDTVAVHQYYGDPAWKMESATIDTPSWLRWTWLTDGPGWAYLGEMTSYKAVTFDSGYVAAPDTTLWVRRAPGIQGYFQVAALDSSGNNGGWSDFAAVRPGILRKIRAWPNPSRGPVRWRWDLAPGLAPSIRVYNALGQALAEITGFIETPGENRGKHSYTFNWSGHTADGNKAASGIYFYRATARNAAAAGTVVIIQ